MCPGLPHLARQPALEDVDAERGPRAGSLRVIASLCARLRSDPFRYRAERESGERPAAALRRAVFPLWNSADRNQVRAEVDGPSTRMPSAGHPDSRRSSLEGIQAGRMRQAPRKPSPGAAPIEPGIGPSSDSRTIGIPTPGGLAPSIPAVSAATLKPPKSSPATQSAGRPSGLYRCTSSAGSKAPEPRTPPAVNTLSSRVTGTG